MLPVHALRPLFALFLAWYVSSAFWNDKVAIRRDEVRDMLLNAGALHPDKVAETLLPFDDDDGRSFLMLNLVKQREMADYLASFQSPNKRLQMLERRLDYIASLLALDKRDPSTIALDTISQDLTFDVVSVTPDSRQAFIDKKRAIEQLSQTK